MAYSAINVGSIVNGADGDTSLVAMGKINDNDIDIETNIDTLTSTRIAEIANSAKHDEANVFSFPNATEEYQILEGGSVILDFSVEKPHNFYLPHGSEIYLDAPLGLEAGFYPKGWILTEGFVTNWENTFIEGDDNTKPLTYSSYVGQGLYLYFVLSPTVIVFRKFKTAQITEVASDVLYPVTFNSITDNIVSLVDGTFITELVLDWTKHVSDTTSQYRVVISNGTDIVFDTTVITEGLVVSPIVDTGVEHTVTIYATNGRSLSTPESLTNTPSGDSSTEQTTATGPSLTLGTDSLWGKDSLDITTFYLDAETGDVTIGNPDDRNIKYTASTGILNAIGTIRVEDIGSPTVTEYGKFATGTADYDVSTGPSGTGVLLGSPGIYGVKSGEFTFQVNNDGFIVFGYEDGDNMTFDPTTGILESTGENRIKDVTSGVTITKYGYFATGTAAYDTATDVVSGSGILLGSPGLYGVNSGDITFHLDPSTGQLWLDSGTTIIGDGTIDNTIANATYIGYEAQRTADIAVKNTLDVNIMIEILNRAATLSVNGGADNTFIFKM